MAEDFTTHDLVGKIFEDIDAEEQEAEAEDENEQEQETENTEKPEEDDEEESEDEEEEAEEEEVPEPADEDSEESSVKDVDKKDSKKYNSDDDKEEEPKFYKVVVDGEEEEVPLDTLIRDYQRAQASSRRFEEAAAKERANEIFLEGILENPGEAITDLLCDDYCAGDRVQARQLVVNSFLSFLEPERTAAKLKDEQEKALFLKQQEIDLKQREMERQQRKRAELAEIEAEQEFEKDFRTALLKEHEKLGLPNEPVIWRRTEKLLEDFEDELPAKIRGDINLRRRALLESVKDTMSRVAEEVQKTDQELREERKKRLKSDLSDDELAEIDPELVEARKQLRIARAKKKKSGKKAGVVKKKETESKKKQPQKRIISTAEAFGFSDTDF